MCAFSLSAPVLVAGRAVQGLGGGGVVVLVHVCVSDMFDIRYVIDAGPLVEEWGLVRLFWRVVRLGLSGTCGSVGLGVILEERRLT